MNARETWFIPDCYWLQHTTIVIYKVVQIISGQGIYNLHNDCILHSLVKYIHLVHLLQPFLAVPRLPEQQTKLWLRGGRLLWVIIRDTRMPSGEVINSTFGPLSPLSLFVASSPLTIHFRRIMYGKMFLSFCQRGEGAIWREGRQQSKCRVYYLSGGHPRVSNTIGAIMGWCYDIIIRACLQ